jgi:hypothetical protein
MNHDEQDLRDALARLGDPPPPPGLDARIWNTRKRRIRRASDIGSVATAGVLVAAILALHPRPDGDSPATATVAARTSPAPASDGDVIADIRAIDHALQLAYTRHASEDEVAPLWKARRELLLRLEPSASGSGFI